MKTIRAFFILLYCLLFANMDAFPQLIRLLDTNNMWSVLEIDDRPAGFPGKQPYKISHWLKPGNDTILNGKTYKIVLYSTDEHHSTWENSGLFMREEEGKVYWCDQDELREDETLLYDFNLQEGESISRYLNSYLDYQIISVVDSIRSVQLGGSLRKIFYISNTLYPDDFKRPEIWIEGIGSLWGLRRNNPCSFSTGCQVYQVLLCYYQDGEEFYHSPDFDDCYYNWTWSGIKNPGLISDFQLYPNPSSGKFYIVTDISDGSSTVQIFDSVGKQIRSYRTSALRHTEVDISDVPSGIYFVRLINQNSSGIKKMAIKK